MDDLFVVESSVIYLLMLFQQHNFATQRDKPTKGAFTLFWGYTFEKEFGNFVLCGRTV
jgi:hypothetical protein